MRSFSSFGGKGYLLLSAKRKEIFKFGKQLQKAREKTRPSVGVMYDSACPGCMSRYVGCCSMRNIHIRISEHKGRSYRTNRLLHKPLFSKIREHAFEMTIQLTLIVSNS